MSETDEQVTNEQPINDQLILISGESASGKSASLINIRNKERWAYLNCEAGKRLPFPNKFKSATITDPYEVYTYFDHVKENPDFDGIIIDSLTFLMDMFESIYIIGSSDGQKAWGSFAQFFKKLMQYHIASSDKSVIVLAHTRSDYDEKSLSMKTMVPIKGSLKNNGIEAYFSTVVSAKKIELNQLDNMDPALLRITPQNQSLGYKHVFQTQLTKATIGERIRSPMGMFTQDQTYIDNDAQLLLDHLDSYYRG